SHLDQHEEAQACYRKAIALDPLDVHPWNGLGNFYCDDQQKFIEAAAAYQKALEIDNSNESAQNNLVFLYRDFLDNLHEARKIFASLQNLQKSTFRDSTKLHEALFAAYDSNWGLCREALAQALEIIESKFPRDTIDDWFRASAVLLHLNYGKELLAFLGERG